jgi:DNA-binding transcriptional LysR family regulator
MSMLDSLRGYVVFAHVAQTQSFSRAAERLGITKSAVSKHVAQLEADLGVQLIVRTTRKLSLTDAGTRVFALCSRVASDIEAARDAALDARSAIAGKLRITAPAALGRNYLMPVVSDFLAQYPEVSIEAVLSDEYVDLLGERIDIALRVGEPGDQSLISRRIARVEFFLVASPRYLERRGMPRAPAELAQHDWIVHSPTRDSHITLHKGKASARVPVQGRLTCNDGPSNLAAAIAGHGILGVPDFEAAPALQTQELVRVLPAWRIDDSALHLTFPPRRHVLSRVRTFAEFVTERFKSRPWCVAATTQRRAAGEQ